MEDYPEIQEHLGSNSYIVNNQDFESGLVKIMSKTFLSLTELQYLLLDNNCLQTIRENTFCGSPVIP